MGSGNSKKSQDLDSLCEHLARGHFKNVIVMCGAGISTSAGIPDFRTPSLGLYNKLRKYNLPYPEAIFEGRYFRQDPKPFYDLVRELFPQSLVPTPTHQFFSLLHQKGILKRIYTQNIDGLEFCVGLPEDKVVEAHGTFHRCYCSTCQRPYSLPWLMKEMFENGEHNEGVPKCSDCGHVVRPDVVLFGEALPSKFHDLSHEDFQDCDLLLIFGTSLAVAPFNGLISKVGRDVPRVYINLSKPGYQGFVPWLLSLGRNVDFSGSHDLIVLGKCDETVERICTKTHWGEELKSIPSEPVKF